MIAAIVAACTSILTIGGAVAMVGKVVMPAKRQLDTVKELDRRSRLDYEARKQQERCNEAMVKVLVAVCRSLESHPEIDEKAEIQDAYEDLRVFLIERRNII